MGKVGCVSTRGTMFLRYSLTGLHVFVLLLAGNFLLFLYPPNNRNKLGLETQSVRKKHEIENDKKETGSSSFSIPSMRLTKRKSLIIEQVPEHQFFFVTSIFNRWLTTVSFFVLSLVGRQRQRKGRRRDQRNGKQRLTLEKRKRDRAPVRLTDE